MPSRQLVLASASPARARILRDAGIDPQVVVSGFDESSVHEPDPAALVASLAEQKARAVTAALGDADVLVLGCDSLLSLGDDVLGKPADRDVALARWQRMRGRSGALLTGHFLIDLIDGRTAAEATSTVVRFGAPSDAGSDAYVATGEPLAVAGGFTLDGRSGAFVDGIDGDHGTVLGLSLPALRRMLRSLGIELHALWS